MGYVARAKLHDEPLVAIASDANMDFDRPRSLAVYAARGMMSDQYFRSYSYLWQCSAPHRCAAATTGSRYPPHIGGHSHHESGRASMAAVGAQKSFGSI